MNEIILGDALKLFKDLKNNSVTHVLTSPPYNRKRNDKYTFYNDTLKDYYTFLKVVLEESLRVSSEYVFFNIQKNYYNKVELYKIIGDFSDKIQEVIVWGKTNPMPASGNNITNSFEYIFVLGDKPLKGNKTYTKNLLITSVNTSKQSIHKAVMKEEVCDWLIDNFTQPNDLILDPFMGTGTTAVCAKKLGRNYLGFEICEEYINLSKDRLQNINEYF